MFYHAHIYFDIETRKTALSVRKKMAKNFPSLYIGKIGKDDVLFGPHTKPMFESTIMDKDLGSILPWIIFNSQKLSVLLHPCSDNTLLDHTERAMWLGKRIPLDLEKL